MSFGDGNLHDDVMRLSESNDRLMSVNGSLCAEINRQEHVIRELESLVRDMLPWVWESGIGAAEYDSIIERAAELGIGEGR